MSPVRTLIAAGSKPALPWLAATPDKAALVLDHGRHCVHLCLCPSRTSTATGLGPCAHRSELAFDYRNILVYCGVGCLRTASGSCPGVLWW